MGMKQSGVPKTRTQRASGVDAVTALVRRDLAYLAESGHGAQWIYDAFGPGWSMKARRYTAEENVAYVKKFVESMEKAIRDVANKVARVREEHPTAVVEPEERIKVLARLRLALKIGAYVRHNPAVAGIARDIMILFGSIATDGKEDLERGKSVLDTAMAAAEQWSEQRRSEHRRWLEIARRRAGYPNCKLETAAAEVLEELTAQAKHERGKKPQKFPSRTTIRDVLGRHRKLS